MEYGIIFFGKMTWNLVFMIVHNPRGKQFKAPSHLIYLCRYLSHAGTRFLFSLSSSFNRLCLLFLSKVIKSDMCKQGLATYISHHIVSHMWMSCASDKVKAKWKGWDVKIRLLSLLFKLRWIAKYVAWLNENER